MVFSENMKNSAYFHYSPTYKYSLGIEILNDKYFDKDYLYFRATYLLHRTNTRNSQKNFYLNSGVSSEGLRNHFFGVHGDWETRRWFTGFGFKQIKTDRQNYSDQYFQLGVAPYLGNYGDLHTWIMLKTEKNTVYDEDWSILPVLKFLKGNLLFEFGYSKKTRWDAHLMYRF